MANTYPEPIPQPFGINGDRSPIVNTPEVNVPSWPLGYPPNFSIPLPDGAQIERKEWNQLLYILSANQFWQQKANLPTFDPKVGKYPKGALLWAIPPQDTIIKSANDYEYWCGLELLYGFNTEVKRFPVPVISLVENNTIDFVSNQREFIDGWAIFGEPVIETSSVAPPSTINNVIGKISTVVTARRKPLAASRECYAEKHTRLTIEPPVGYSFIKTQIAPSINLFGIGAGGSLTQIQALFPYWTQDFMLDAGPDAIFKATIKPSSYPPDGVGVWAMSQDIPINFIVSSSSKPYLQSWGASIVSSNWSPPTSFNIETIYV